MKEYQILDNKKTNKTFKKSKHKGKHLRPKFQRQ